MKDVFELPLPGLVNFIKVSCHDSLYEALLEVREMSLGREKNELTRFVSEFISTVQRHLNLEELNIFPFVGREDVRVEAHHITDLIDEHDQIKVDLLRLRMMTHHYADETDPYQKLLKEMDRIILNHIQMEDHILFPMMLED